MVEALYGEIWLKQLIGTTIYKCVLSRNLDYFDCSKSQEVANL